MFSVADEDEEKRYRESASSDGGRPEELTTPATVIADRQMTPMKQIEMARQQWRHLEERNLEKSWTSLDLFDRSQKGRISIDLESKYRSGIVSRD